MNQSAMWKPYRFAALCLCLLFFKQPMLAQQPHSDVPKADGSTEAVVEDSLHVLSAMESALGKAIEAAEPAVVSISRVHRVQTLHSMVPQDPLAELRFSRSASSPSDSDFVPTAVGAGVVLDSQGLILTHASLVVPGDLHWVTTSKKSNSGNKSFLAKIVASDPRSGLAILAIEASGLKAIKFASATNLKRGQFVIALGNPYSIARDGQASASFGIIANTGRKAQFGNSQKRTSVYEYGALLQTDAKLNLGTAGGPVLNLRGEMIALTTTLSVGANFDQAAGYAIPIDSLFRRAIDKLKQGREVEYGLLGVSFSSIPGAWRNQVNGVPIAEAVLGGPAYVAGLRPRDIITQINDERIDDVDDLILKVSRLPPLEKVRLHYIRNGSSKEVAMTLSKSPLSWKPTVTKPEVSWRGLSVDYATASNNFSQAARRGLVDPMGSVAIRDVEPESIAWKAGFRPGMFIRLLDGKRVKTPKQFHQIASNANGPVQVQLTLPKNQQPERLLPDET